MSSAEILILQEKARKEGHSAGKIEGAATVQASCIIALRQALASGDLQSGVVELIDHLNSKWGANSLHSTDECYALADRLAGKPAADPAAKQGETQTQAAERVLRENGLWKQGGGAVGAPQSSGDLGDQVVAVLAAKRGAK